MSFPSSSYSNALAKLLQALSQQTLHAEQLGSFVGKQIEELQEKSKVTGNLTVPRDMTERKGTCEEATKTLQNTTQKVLATAGKPVSQAPAAAKPVSQAPAMETLLQFVAPRNSRS